VLRSGERWLVLLLLFCFTQAYQTFLVGGLPSQGTGEVLTEDQVRLLRLAWGGIYAGALALALVRWRAVFSVMSATPWLTLLLVLFPLSTAWSVAPEETLRRGFAMLATGLFGFYLAARFDHRDLVRLLVQALGVTMVLSLLAGLLVRAVGIETGDLAGAWRGVFPNKTQLGLHAVLYVAFLLLLATSGAYRTAGLVARLVLGGALCVLSLSIGPLASGLLVAAALMLVVLARAQPEFRVPASTLFVSAFLLLVCLFVLGAAFAEEILALLGRDMTLSGRTLVWGEVIGLIERRPLLGYGYGAIWRTYTPYLDAVNMAVGWSPGHSHNGYLDLLLALGIIGTMVFAGALLAAIARLLNTLRHSDTTVTYFSVTVLTFSLVQSLVESQMLAEGKLLSVLFIATLAALPRLEHRRPRVRGAEAECGLR
jgi:exopolysaccharide production protein ExoQ